jgi:hypothetical protein
MNGRMSGSYAGVRLGSHNLGGLCWVHGMGWGPCLLGAALAGRGAGGVGDGGVWLRWERPVMWWVSSRRMVSMA